MRTLFKCVALFVALLCYMPVQAQTSTPNIGLQIPQVGSNNWYIPLNYNFSKLDLMLGGVNPVPRLQIQNNLTVGGTITAGAFVGVGGGSFPTISGSITNSQCAYWVTATTVGSRPCGGSSAGGNLAIQGGDGNGGFFGSAAKISVSGDLIIPSTSTFKYLAGSPTATYVGSVAGAVANCLTTPCYVTIDPAYTGTDTYSALADQTFINDLRYGAQNSTAYNWAHQVSAGYFDANQENCLQSNVPNFASVATGVYLTDCHRLTYNSTFPGRNINGYWFVSTGHQLNTSQAGAGIMNGIGVACSKTSTGDANCTRTYVNCVSGFVTGSDEGCKALAVSAAEINTMYTGSVASSALNSSRQAVLTLTSPSNVSSLGVGRPLINKTTGVLSGTASSISTSNGFATVTVSGFSAVASSCSSPVASAIATPLTATNAPITMTVTLSGLPSALTVNENLWIAGVAADGGANAEQAYVASIVSGFSGGNQTVTIPLTHEYAAGAKVCGGGTQGFVENTAYTSTGFRFVNYVIGAPTTSTLLVTMPWGTNGLDPAFISTGAVKVYQGGTLVDVRDSAATNLAVDGLQLTVSPGGVWNAADVVENPDLTAGAFTTFGASVSVNNPWAAVTGIQTTQSAPTLRGGDNFQAVTNYGPANLSAYGGIYSSDPLAAHLGAAPPAAGIVLNAAPVGGQYYVANVAGSVEPAGLWVGPFITSPISFTAYSIVSNYITFTVSGTNPLQSASNQYLTLSGYGTSTFLNGQVVLVTGATATTVTAYIAHANASATEAGAAVITPNQGQYYVWLDKTHQRNLQYDTVLDVLKVAVQTDFQGNKIKNIANGAASTDAAAFGQLAALQNLYWNIQPGLFVTSTVLGAIYKVPYAATYTTLTMHAGGTASCTTTPTINLLDLGTSAATAYGSATTVTGFTVSAIPLSSVTQLTGTFTVAAGHYIAVGFAAGTCATYPTLDATLN